MFKGRKRSGGWAWGAKSHVKKAKTVNAKISRLQRQVALLKPEVKYFVTSQSINNVTQAAGAIAYVSDIQQGTSDNTRIGDSVRGVSFRVRGTGEPTGSTDFRFLVIQDMDSNGVVPVISGTAESIFYDFTARACMVQSLTANRYKVLWERYYNASSIVYGDSNGGYIDTGYIKLSKPITFRANAGNNTDAGKNALYVVILVDDADTMDFNFRTELKYTDV